MPPEKTIFTIFRMSLLIILWIFGTFLAYGPYCPSGEKILRTALQKVEPNIMKSNGTKTLPHFALLDKIEFNGCLI